MSGRHRLPRNGDWLARLVCVGEDYYVFRIKYRRGVYL